MRRDPGGIWNAFYLYAKTYDGCGEGTGDEVLYVPAALALHQRPGIPGIRSTFGTGTELLNSLRLMYSRLASHRCPNGHYVEPTLKVAAEQEILCPICGEQVQPPSAEELAFNSQGACPECGGTGRVRTVNIDSLVPDDSISIDDGAVATVEQSDVVTDDGCMSGNGCAHGYSVSRADGERKRYCLSRAGGKETYFL